MAGLNPRPAPAPTTPAPASGHTEPAQGLPAEFQLWAWDDAEGRGELLAEVPGEVGWDGRRLGRGATRMALKLVAGEAVGAVPGQEAVLVTGPSLRARLYRAEWLASRNHACGSYATYRVACPSGPRCCAPSGPYVVMEHNFHRGAGCNWCRLARDRQARELRAHLQARAREQRRRARALQSAQRSPRQRRPA